MIEERRVVRIGRRSGVAGTSADWHVVVRGRVRTVDLDWIRDGLKADRLTGVEQVRRADGDWGPLFGRPVYRQVFKATRRDGRVDGMEPRDHAKARARGAIQRLARKTTVLAGLAGVALVVSLPPVVAWLPIAGAALLTQLGLLVAAVLAVGAGLLRLRTTMARVELASLKDRLVPPVTPPPPLLEDNLEAEADAEVDWALEAARDEVDAYLSSGAESTASSDPSGSST